MNKTAIKNFAVWARNKLIAEIIYKAGLLGITDKGIKAPLPQSTKDVQFFDIGAKEPYSITGVEIEQRRNLSEVIQKKEKQTDYKTAYKSVVEEVAYTWFNRLIAVRFMEVNDYLPSRIRVLSSESGTKSEPDLVTSPFEAELDYEPYERDRIMQLKNDNKLDELFRMLFIKQCNALNAILPDLFEKTNDYTELLMNVSFTDKDGVVYHLVNDIPEDDFNVEKEGQVEIIGWLYQYYNTEPKDETFALLKKNVKITKERIPAATQLFTPDWIVRYMVENSLGRLWLEGHPNDDLKAGWKYYLDEAEQEPEVQAQLDAIRNEYKTIKPEDIKVIDPCMGSGHILVYAFDVLMQIYESYGYSQRDAAKSIVENNLYGLDIDNRAYQLAYFAVMMKARQYNRRILDGKTKYHVYAILESNGINRTHLKHFGYGMTDLERSTALNQMEYLLDTISDAKEYGSILNIDNLNWELLYRYLNNVDFNGQVSFDTVGLDDDKQNRLRKLVELASVMAQKYDVVVTNPPYMGAGGMNNKLSSYVKNEYPIAKADMSTVFMKKTIDLCHSDGFMAMINIPVWMFLSSYEPLRKDLLEDVTFYNMLHLGRGIFGSDFGTTSFVTRRSRIKYYQGTYRRLFRKQSLVDSIEQKEKWFLEGKGLFLCNQEAYSKISGMSFAYWASEKTRKCFENRLLNEVADIRSGISTGDNDRFYRLWFEVSDKEISFTSSLTPTNSEYKWFPIIRAGEYRKWWGNRENILNLQHDAYEIKNAGNNFRLRTPGFYNKLGITWCRITIGDVSFRIKDELVNFGENSPSMFFKNEDDAYYFLGLLNTKVISHFLSLINPTMTYQVVDISSLPIIVDDRTKALTIGLVKECIALAKQEFNEFEVSWDFRIHPLVHFANQSSLNVSYNAWELSKRTAFYRLKECEEQLNRMFITLYGLDGEIMPDIEENDITFRRNDLQRDIRSFVSYAVGCIFGRYSLDKEGLAYAGGEWDDCNYTTFTPHKDNVIPITDEEYFEDDLLGLFCVFLKKSFGTDTLEENLNFIANALGNKGNSSRDVIRNYFMKDFFNDHCKIYQKRPIYWLFDSGKADGFKALVYIHRYNADSIGNLRIDYLHRLQRVYDSEIARMQETIDNSNNPREVAAANKRKEKLTKQLKETKEYDEKIAHLALARISIDLDDGVKVNYDKIQTGTDGKKLDVLAKI
ncbi:MAG: BREX-1 system adenine-specific DNA-methyltransferase PglX [Bacillota bacterium]